MVTEIEAQAWIQAHGCVVTILDNMQLVLTELQRVSTQALDTARAEGGAGQQEREMYLDGYAAGVQLCVDQLNGLLETTRQAVDPKNAPHVEPPVADDEIVSLWVDHRRLPPQ